MAEKITDLLESARQAYRQGNRRDGAAYAEEILARDFLHPHVWQLLHEQYGRGRPFEAFQRAFVQKFYPQMLPILERGYAEEKASPDEQESPSQLFFPFNIIVDFFRGLFPRQAHTDENEPLPGSLEITQPRPYRDSLPFPSSEIVETGLTEKLEPETADKPPTQDAPPAAPVPSQTTMRGSAPHTEHSPPISTGGRHGGGSDPIRVLIVDDIAEVRENIARSLKFQEGFEIVGIATDGFEAIEKARYARPEVVLMDVNMPNMDGITASSKILEYLPNAQIIMLTVQDEPDYIRSAMRSGASDYLVKPPIIDELISSVERAGAVAKKERTKAPVSIPTPAEGALGLSGGKLITVYSPKGGTGCTLLAANLAACLHNNETQVVLVDADLYYGNLIVHFNEQSETTILDLAARADELDPELVEEVLISHESGIKILAAPKRPEHGDVVSGNQFETILKYLQDRYPYVIVDLSHRLSDVALAAFDNSDVLVLLTTQDVPAIAHTREFIQLIPRLQIDLDRVLVVMTQYDNRINIAPERVSHSLRKDIAAVVPRDNRLVVKSINRGAPILLQSEAKSDPLATAILELAEAIRRKLIQEPRAEKTA